jgi:hypothetical protein
MSRKFLGIETNHHSRVNYNHSNKGNSQEPLERALGGQRTREMQTGVEANVLIVRRETPKHSGWPSEGFVEIRKA